MTTVKYYTLLALFLVSVASESKTAKTNQATRQLSTFCRTRDSVHTTLPNRPE